MIVGLGTGVGGNLIASLCLGLDIRMGLGKGVEMVVDGVVNIFSRCW